MHYKEIWKVNLKSFGKNTLEFTNNSFILMEEEQANEWMNTSNKSETCTDYCVDLTGDLWYTTEYYIDEVLEKYPVNSLEDIIRFCSENNITNANESFSDYRIGWGILVGGEKTDLITDDLDLEINYKPNIEMNVWMNIDESQWVKYIDNKNNLSHTFEVVDCILNDTADKPHCIFRHVTVTVDERDLVRGDYDNVIEPFYSSLDSLLDNNGSDYSQIVAECIAEYYIYDDDMNYAKDLFTFYFDENAEDITDELHARCDEVEEYLINNLK